MERFWSKPIQFVKEIFGKQEKRILVIGSNYEDGVMDLAREINQFLEQKHHPKLKASWIKNHRVIGNAITGVDENGVQITPPASMVLAGHHVRDYDGDGAQTWEIEPFINDISNLCQKLEIPLVRFSYFRDKQRFEFDTPIEDAIAKIQ